MQSTAQLWLVYKLTGSAALLGVFGFASQVPMLFLSSIGGYVGDRYDRRRGVMWTQTASMILAFVLAGLTLGKIITVWELILIAFLVGIVNAFDVPIRQAFFVQMVGKEDLPNAIALNSSIFHGARVVGPAIAGTTIAWLDAHHVKSSEGWCFLMNGLSFLAVIGALAAMRIPKTEPKPREGSPFQNFIQGFRFAMHDLPIRSTLLLLSVLSLFGLQYAVFLPLFAKDILHSGARGFGLLMSSAGGWRRSWSAALCRADGLQGTGAMDRGDVHDLRDWPGGVRGIANFLAIVGGATDRRICSNVPNDGDEHADSKSRTG